MLSKHAQAALSLFCIKKKSLFRLILILTPLAFLLARRSTKGHFVHQKGMCVRDQGGGFVNHAIEFIETPLFTRQIKQLASDDELKDLQKE
jgi:hypothetical protein